MYTAVSEHFVANRRMGQHGRQMDTLSLPNNQLMKGAEQRHEPSHQMFQDTARTTRIEE